MQFKVRFDSCTNLIFHGKTPKNVFVVEYRICVISSQSWHLHISDFPLQNTQKDVFSGGIMHLFNLKSELTGVQIGFPTVKHSKRRVLRWVIAFVQFKVRVCTCKKLIFHSNTHNKTCFEVEYRICAISSLSWHLHKSDFPLQTTQKDVFCNRILHLWT